MDSGDPPPDLLLLFASSAYGESFTQLVQTARERTGAASLIGCSVSGFLAGGEEIEDRPGLSLMALWLPGATLHPLRLHQEHIEFLDDPAIWHELYPIPEDEVRSWLVLAEPYRIDVQAMLTGLQQRYPAATIMGGQASGMIEDRKSCVFFDSQWFEEGAVAIGIGGPYSIRPVVSQGCEPIGESWTITEVDRNSVVTISNRPAIDILQQTVLALPAGKRQQAQNNLVIGLAVNEYRDSFERGDFVMRGMLGLDRTRGSIAVGGLPRVGQTLQFQLRDSATADLDLREALTRFGNPGGDAVAAFLCTCDGRGAALFGTRNHDSELVLDAMGTVPLVGGFFLGEIGPLGDRAVLQGFTATIGLLQRDPQS